MAVFHFASSFSFSTISGVLNDLQAKRDQLLSAQGILHQPLLSLQYSSCGFVCLRIPQITVFTYSICYLPYLYLLLLYMYLCSLLYLSPPAWLPPPHQLQVCLPSLLNLVDCPGNLVEKNLLPKSLAKSTI